MKNMPIPKGFWSSSNRSAIFYHHQFIKLTDNELDVCRTSKKGLWVIVGIVLIFFIVCLVLGAFYDYDIDKALATKYLNHNQPDTIDLINGSALSQLNSVGTSSLYSKIVDHVYNLPKVIVSIFCLGVCFCNTKRIKNQVGRYASGIAIYCLCCWFIYKWPFANYLPSGWYFVLLASFASIWTTGMFFFCLGFVKQQTMNELLRWALICGCAITMCSVTNRLLKQSFQRERYFYIYAFSQVNSIYDHGAYIGTGSEYSNLIYGGFHPWYALPIPTNAFHQNDITESFPSGHVNGAASGILCIFLLPFLVRKCNHKVAKPICFSITPLWIIATMFARLVAGAHYLSDVTMAALICCIWFGIFYWVFTYYGKWLGVITHLWIYPHQPSSK